MINANSFAKESFKRKSVMRLSILSCLEKSLADIGIPLVGISCSSLLDKTTSDKGDSQYGYRITAAIEAFCTREGEVFALFADSIHHPFYSSIYESLANNLVSIPFFLFDSTSIVMPQDISKESLSSNSKSVYKSYSNGFTNIDNTNDIKTCFENLYNNIISSSLSLNWKLEYLYQNVDFAVQRKLYLSKDFKVTISLPIELTNNPVIKIIEWNQLRISLDAILFHSINNNNNANNNSEDNHNDSYSFFNQFSNTTIEELLQKIKSSHSILTNKNNNINDNENENNQSLSQILDNFDVDSYLNQYKNASISNSTIDFTSLPVPVLSNDLNGSVEYFLLELYQLGVISPFQILKETRSHSIQLYNQFNKHVFKLEFARWYGTNCISTTATNLSINSIKWLDYLPQYIIKVIIETTLQTNDQVIRKPIVPPRQLLYPSNIIHGNTNDALFNCIQKHLITKSIKPLSGLLLRYWISYFMFNTGSIEMGIKISLCEIVTHCINITEDCFITIPFFLTEIIEIIHIMMSISNNNTQYLDNISINESILESFKEEAIKKYKFLDFNDMIMYISKL
jgi:hypothetical protein